MHGNGIATAYRYNLDGQLTALESARIQKLDYDYDAAGRITGIRRNTTPERYRYDPNGRLIEARNATGQYTYQYDALGNRTHKARTASPTTTTEYRYEETSNRLLATEASPQIPYAYDAAGNPTRIGTRAYEYNAEHRPVKLSIDGQLRAEYAYNAWGERIKKVVYHGSQKKVTYYLYDGHQLTAEADGEGRIRAQYVYLGHRPIAKLEGKQIYAIHTDHLGTPQAVTDDDGEIVWRADYAPFGKAYIRKAGITLNLRFPGQYEDQEAGTYYNYLRDYNPETGRYLTSDPIGLKGGFNSYAYVGGNPLEAIDPLGLFQATPGTPPYEALVRAGAIAAADGPEPFYGDVAAVAYLAGFAIAMGIDLLLDDGYADAVEQSDFDTIVNEIQLYKPSYTYDTPAGWSPNWDSYYGLLDELYNTQLGYLSACTPDYAPPTPELLQRASRGVAFANNINPILAVNDTLIDQQLELAYEDYKADGGYLTFEDWVAQGMPESGIANEVKFSEKQLQKKYKHAKDFSAEGDYSKAKAAEFQQAIQNHIDDSATEMMPGTYRWAIQGRHYYNPTNDLWVFVDSSGQFHTGWKLSPTQASDLLSKGNVY